MSETVLDEFYENDVVPRLKIMLDKVEEEFQNRRHQLKDSLIQEFRQICVKAGTIQKDKSFPIGFLMFHPLRTRLLNRDYRYQAWIYDEEWYVHEGFPVGDMDVSFAYQFYDILWNQLLKEYPKYRGKLTEMDVEQIMLRILEAFHYYVTELLRYSLLDALETDEYQALERASIFHIECGEMFEPSDVIHIEDQKKKVAKIVKWLDKKEQGAYCFEDFSGLTFQEFDYECMDLRYVDFRDCNLTSARLSICTLNGTKFRRANLTDSDLSVSLIAGADFTGANLENANLCHCVAFMGKGFLNRWRKTGYTETIFRNANLRHVNFRDAVLHGVDFRGADLTGADFTGASLGGSLFDQVALEQCELSEEQKGRIRVE